LSPHATALANPNPLGQLRKFSALKSRNLTFKKLQKLASETTTVLAEATQSRFVHGIVIGSPRFEIDRDTHLPF
jgi:hypothetical protein